MIYFIGTCWIVYKQNNNKISCKKYLYYIIILFTYCLHSFKTYQIIIYIYVILFGIHVHVLVWKRFLCGNIIYYMALWHVAFKFQIFHWIMWAIRCMWYWYIVRCIRCFDNRKNSFLIENSKYTVYRINVLQPIYINVQYCNL